MVTSKRNTKPIKQPRRKGRKAKGRKPQRRNRGMVGAPVNIPALIKNNTSVKGDFIESGVDHYLTTPDLSTYKAGEVIANLLISPALSKRAAMFGRAYQRYSIKHLALQITSMSNTGVSGGYVAAFVADPTDDFSDEAVERLTSQYGSTSQKYYTNSTVTAAVDPSTWYWTQVHNTDSEPRVTYPGRFVIACVVPPDRTAQLKLTVRWTMEFAYKSLEPLLSTASSITNEFPIWTREGHEGLWIQTSTNDWSDDMTRVFPGINIAPDILHRYLWTADRNFLLTDQASPPKEYNVNYVSILPGKNNDILAYPVEKPNDSGQAGGLKVNSAHSLLVYPRGVVFTRTTPAQEQPVFLQRADASLGAHPSDPTVTQPSFSEQQMNTIVNNLNQSTQILAMLNQRLEKLELTSSE